MSSVMESDRLMGKGTCHILFGMLPLAKSIEPVILFLPPTCPRRLTWPFNQAAQLTYPADW